jgi:hypothetical protein
MDLGVFENCGRYVSHFLNLKTPTEDSRLRHERAFFITPGTIEKLACLYYSSPKNFYGTVFAHSDSRNMMGNPMVIF